MQESLLKPLGMRSSTYLWLDDAERRVASGHNSVRQPMRRFWDFARRLHDRIHRSHTTMADWDHDRIVHEMTDPDAPMPNSISPNVAFSLLTNVSDYALFAARLAAPAGDSLDLRPETRALLLTPGSAIDRELYWAAGIGIERQAQQQYLRQWGDNGLWKDFLLVHPASGTAIVVFTNGSNGMRVAERMVNAASKMQHDVFLWA